jgi:hypothetical protein
VFNFNFLSLSNAKLPKDYITIPFASGLQPGVSKRHLRGYTKPSYSNKNGKNTVTALTLNQL